MSDTSPGAVLAVIVMTALVAPSVVMTVVALLACVCPPVARMLSRRE